MHGAMRSTSSSTFQASSTGTSTRNCLRSSLVLLLQSLEIFEGVDVGRAPGVGAVDPLDGAVAIRVRAPMSPRSCMASGQRLRASQHRIARLPVVAWRPGSARRRRRPRAGRTRWRSRAAGRPGPRRPRRRRERVRGWRSRRAGSTRSPPPSGVVDHEHVEAGERGADLVAAVPDDHQDRREPGGRRGVQRPGDEGAAVPLEQRLRRRHHPSRDPRPRGQDRDGGDVNRSGPVRRARA